MKKNQKGYVFAGNKQTYEIIRVKSQYTLNGGLIV